VDRLLRSEKNDPRANTIEAWSHTLPSEPTENNQNTITTAKQKVRSGWSHTSPSEPTENNQTPSRRQNRKCGQEGGKRPYTNQTQPDPERAPAGSKPHSALLKSTAAFGRRIYTRCTWLAAQVGPLLF